jgi:signal transduction histidine kinase
VNVAVAVFGWVAAAGALAMALAARRELAARMERLARASHELRRPLTAARLAAHGLADANGDRPARAAAIERELARAGRLVGDLDAVRGVALGPAWPLESRCVAVGALLRDVAEGFGGGVVMERCDEDSVVCGDSDRLAQAIANLAANALEHGSGPVRLGTRVGDGRAVVRVSDGGAGLPAPMDELVRGAHGGRGARGRGLAIAADIVRSHGGVLRAEAGFDLQRPERPVMPGACLVIDLPLAAQASAVR